jgi:hypothetical protein
MVLFTVKAWEPEIWHHLSISSNINTVSANSLESCSQWSQTLWNYRVIILFGWITFKCFSVVLIFVLQTPWVESLKSCQSLSFSIISPHLMVPEDSLPRSQSHTLGPILSQMNPAHNIPSYFSDFQINITPPPPQVFVVVSFLLYFHWNLTCIPLFLCKCKYISIINKPFFANL